MVLAPEFNLKYLVQVLMVTNKYEHKEFAMDVLPTLVGPHLTIE